ncbi:YbaN family protein [Hylemonella sp. W303a]|uniref:YbaN family protein n=1 Tax=Hylemonella sp. W303a TaxID=3389873 RepID=UPI00396B2D7B
MLPRLFILLLWRVLAVVCVALGVIGAFLPVMPTVVFLLVAAWAAGKGWPQLEVWLLTHPRHGASIRAWRERGAVPRRAKWLASLMMGVSSVALAASPLALWWRIGLPLGMGCVALWLWTRPEV